MIGIKRIDEKGWSARGGQRSGNLGADISTFSYSRDNDLATAAIHHIDSFLKVFVELGNEIKDGLSLFTQTACGIFSGMMQSFFGRGLYFFCFYLFVHLLFSSE